MVMMVMMATIMLMLELRELTSLKTDRSFILNTLWNEPIRARLAPARLPCALKHHVTAPYAREHHVTAACALKRHVFSSCALKHLFIARGAY